MSREVLRVGRTAEQRSCWLLPGVFIPESQQPILDLVDLVDLIQAL
jgi:hypothetical protein